MKKYIYIFLIILVLIAVILVGYLNKSKQNNDSKKIKVQNSEEVISVRVREETEGGYVYYKTEDKELIEKVINALDNIKIEEKTDISFSDNGKTYILELADGTTQEYNFQGSYYCKDKINYKISNYKELNKIVLTLGYSHPVEMVEPEGITYEVPNPNSIIVKGIDKELVGQMAAEIRSKRPPEVYRGKGIKYVDEHIRRKEGKTGK